MKYFLFDGGRLLGRRNGYNVPELLGGAVPDQWAPYPDIERWDTNVQEISKDEFTKLLKKKNKATKALATVLKNNPYHDEYRRFAK